jgi:hypothetical protein
MKTQDAASESKTISPFEVYYGTWNQKLKQREMTKNRTLNSIKKHQQKFKLN